MNDWEMLDLAEKVEDLKRKVELLETCCSKCTCCEE